MASSDRSTSKRYFYANGGQRCGPVTAQELRHLAASGKLSRSDMVWQEGVEKGALAGKIQKLFPANSGDFTVPPTNCPKTVNSANSAAPSSPSLAQSASSGTPAPPPGRFEPVIGGVRRKDDSPPFKTEGLVSTRSPDWPVMRINVSFWRTQVIAVYEDEVLVGSRYFVPLAFTDELCAPEGRTLLRKRLHRSRTASFERVASVTEECARPQRSAAGVTEHRGKSTMFIRTVDGGKFKLALPALQAPGVRQAIGLRFGNRFSIQEPPRRLLAVALLTVSAFLCPPAFVGALYALLEDMDSSLPALGLAAVAGALLCTGVALYRRRKSGVSLAEWLAVPQKRPESKRWYSRPRRSLIAVDRNGRTPYRSKLAGWSCKTVALSYFILLASPLTDGLTDHVEQALKSNYTAKSTFWALAWSPAVCLMYLGYQLSQRPYNPKDPTDTRRPIVFLRPFSDDQSTSLQPVGLLAKLSGVRPNHGISYSHETVASDLGAPEGRLSRADILMSMHPARLTRMFFDIGVDTSEECLARFFELFGPVVAIGQPGQAFSAPGAQRMYCDDASWRSAVLAEFERAQAIIIQPGVTPGVRWELEQIRQHVEPFRVLICLAAYWRDPERYDELRRLVHVTLNSRLPRHVPFVDRFSFVWFERDWTPRLQCISYKNPIFWPITGDATDLRYTLQPFLQGMHGGEREAPREAKWQFKWRVSTLLSIPVAVILAFIALIVPIVGVNLVGSIIPNPWAIEAQSAPGAADHRLVTEPTVDTPEDLLLRQAREGRPIEYRGKAMDYTITLPPLWVDTDLENDDPQAWHQVIDAGSKLGKHVPVPEHSFLLSERKLARVSIEITDEEWDLDLLDEIASDQVDFKQKLLAGIAADMDVKVWLVGLRKVQVAEQEWGQIESRIEFVGSNRGFTEIMRVASYKGRTLIVAANVLQDHPAVRKLVMEALDSVRIIRAPPPPGWDEPWTGRMVIVTRSGVRFGKRDGSAKTAYLGTLNSLIYMVLADEDGRLLIRDRGQEGWFAKDDAVLEEKAVDYFAERIWRNPNDSSALFGRAEAWRRNGRPDKAIADYTEVIRLIPNDAAAYYNRGVIRQEQQEYEEAIEDYDEAARLDPADPDAVSARGACRYRMGDYNRAVTDQTDAIQLGARRASTFNSRGLAWEAQRQYENAAKDYTEAIKLDPKYADAWCNRGDVFRATGKLAAAFDDYSEAVRLSPKWIEVYDRLGDVALQLGQTADALKYYQAGLEIRRRLAETNPDDAQVQRDLMVSHYKLADAEKQRFDYAAALAHYQQGGAVLSQLIERGLAKEQAERELEIIQRRVALCRAAAVAISGIAEIEAADADRRPMLFYIRCSELARRGAESDLAAVAAAADKLRQQAGDQADHLYLSACGYSLCLRMVDTPPQGGVFLPPTEPRELSPTEQAARQKYVKLALETLAEAIAAGYNSAENMRQDNDLILLRALPEFQKLLDGITQRAEKETP